MKLTKKNNNIIEPSSWKKIPCGTYYRNSLEKGLRIWWPKLFGFYLLKIGALSIELDTNDCIINHKINVGLKGNNLEIIADPYHLPFSSKSIDACLLAHTLSYIDNPHRMLSEIDRILIDDGWLIITTFNPISILGLYKICPILFHNQLYRSHMYSQRRLLNWLFMLNFEALYCTCLQVLPWHNSFEWRLLKNYFQTIGCLNIIIARKRIFPLNLIPFKMVPFRFFNSKESLTLP